MQLVYNLLNILGKVINIKKKLDIKTLPTQGYFYKDDFSISIKRAEVEDIEEYESNFQKENLSLILNKIRKVVEKNTILSEGFKFEDIKSLDVIFIFLEIVRMTLGSNLKLRYYDSMLLMTTLIEFSPKSFNYHKIDSELLELWDSEEKAFSLGGYKFTLPTIGVETSLTNFLIRKSMSLDAEKFSDLNYDFIYFLGHRNRISEEEIENLIHIFNFELDENEMKSIIKLISSFTPMQKYSLIKEGNIIEINKVDLKRIWR
jgi:hypothetical protein